jgi:hypothetical protein
MACAPLVEGTVGVFIRDSKDNLFQGINIRDMREHGIFLAEAEAGPATAPSGNTFNGVVVERSLYAGLRVNDVSIDNTLVVGAQFIENNEGCISEALPGQVQDFATICR